MLSVRLITDPFDLAGYSEHQVSELIPFLQSQFGAWPQTARIYRDHIAVANDVTPISEHDVDYLENVRDGMFYVVVYPGDPITAIIAVVATIALTAAVLLFLTPKLPTGLTTTESSNNSLGSRVNKARPNERIPDIFGQVISIPELLTVPLLIYEDNTEIELCYMCVGRGAYEIDAVKDGATPLSQIAGAGAAFYGPNTTPANSEWVGQTVTPIDGFYASYTTGGIGANANRRYVEMTLTDLVQSVRVTSRIVGTTVGLAVYYNASHTFMSAEQQGPPSGNTQYTDFILTIPPGAKYVAINGITTVAIEVDYLLPAEPELQIGSDIDYPLYDVVKLNDVNGQVLRAPNANSVSGSDNIRFVYPDEIQRSGTDVDFTDFFDIGDTLTVYASDVSSEAGLTTVTQSAKMTLAGEIVFDSYNPSTVFSSGDYLTITNAGYAGETAGGGIQYVDLSGTYLIDTVNSTTITLDAPETINTDWDLIDNIVGDETGYRSPTFSIPVPSSGFNLDGTYTILGVSSGIVTLSNPALVNANWTNLSGLPGGATEYISPTLATTGERWIGPFTVDHPEATQVISNIAALQGMYRVTNKNKTVSNSVQVQIEITPVDSDDVPTGSPETFNITVFGDGTDKTAKGVTQFATTSFTGRSRVRARRITPTDFDYDGTIVDEVKWRDCFGVSPIPASTDFGDVTTVFVRTYATAGATSVKDRKFNCRATRKVLARNMDDTFGPDMIATRNAASIICHMALDPFIGGRALSELDVPQLFDTIAAVTDYFGIPDAGWFSYTFDQSDISFEEMVQTVAQSVFCTAYRQASKLRLFFERATDEATLLFNHRNKLPGSETRTVTFGILKDYDGIELDYVSPDDGATLTIYIPEDQSATKAKKIELKGVQSDAAATLQAWRAFNKLRYQHTTTEFDGLAEGSQLVISERIEVTDNTRPDVFDGYIVSQSGLIVELSQPFEPSPGVDYSIFLQLPSGTVQVMEVSPGDDIFHAVLQSAPNEVLSIDPMISADVTYQIVGDTGGRPSAFLLTEKGAFDKISLNLQAINYDERYYSKDDLYLPVEPWIPDPNNPEQIGWFNSQQFDDPYDEYQNYCESDNAIQDGNTVSRTMYTELRYDDYPFIYFGFTFEIQGQYNITLEFIGCEDLDAIEVKLFSANDWSDSTFFTMWDSNGTGYETHSPNFGNDPPGVSFSGNTASWVVPGKKTWVGVKMTTTNANSNMWEMYTRTITATFN